MRKRRLFLTAAGAAVLAAAALLGAAIGSESGFGMGSGEEKQDSGEGTPATTVIIKDEGGFTYAISEIAEAMIPTVVYINVTGTVSQRSPSPFSDDPFFRFFFGPPEQQEIPVEGLGSGVIVSSDGYILTNDHVVQNADTITVTLHDGKQRVAELVGTDPRTDLAVVKIDPVEGMKYAELGDSDQCRVGEWVIAIGAPRGLDWTVTAGIISAKNRTNIGVLGPTGYEDFIQTDASINPGNSGGPLINLQGKVIGINSLIVSASRGSEGLGFAIPSNMANAISESLITSGTVVRGYIGVQIQDVTPEMARSLGLDRDFQGVIVADVMEDGPADKAGIEQGDVVISFDGDRVTNVSELRNMVAQTAPGTVAGITVVRDGSERDLSIEIDSLEEIEEVAQAPASGDVMGVTVQEVTPEIARRYGLRQTSGVIIAAVAPGSPAERAGLAEGDIIFRVGNEAVDSPGEFQELVARDAADGEVLLLLRDGRTGRVGYVVVDTKG
jgi:serine protease Do